MTAIAWPGSPWWARLVAGAVALVFSVSAATKLRDRPGTARSFAELGLVAPTELAWLVPVLEILTAIVLVVAPVAGAVIALGLLVAFTAVILGVIRSGAAVRCACFGATSVAPVGWGSVVRNLVLIGLAGSVAVAG